MVPFKKHFSGLSPNTFLLTFASLFADVSTEMLYPVLPLFVTETLGASVSAVGLVEGLAQAIQNVVQGLSGWLSDKLERRKPIAIVGYALAAFSKPLIGLSTSWLGVLAARSLDRLGTGIRSAPRDALIAASAEEGSGGKAFGLEGSGDNFGAFVGPLVAIALLTVYQVELRSIFLFAIIPGSLALFMLLLVREDRVATSAKAKLDLNVRQFPRSYWTYLLVTALFGVGNSSASFLILRTKDLGASTTWTIFIYAAVNLVAALVSYPAGHLSDTLGRKPLLLGSFLIFLVVYAGFGFVTNVGIIGALFVLYGAYQGIFRAAGKAFAADFLPRQMRASGVGWYTAVIGLSGLLASIVAGELWTRITPAAAFLYGALCALVGSVGLLLFVPGRSSRAGAVSSHPG
jgi:MFS family permease